MVHTIAGTVGVVSLVCGTSLSVLTQSLCGAWSIAWGNELMIPAAGKPCLRHGAITWLHCFVSGLLQREHNGPAGEL